MLFLTDLFIYYIDLFLSHLCFLFCLGCASGRHGAKEVMSHPWFSSTINWRRLKAGKDKPPFAPDPHAVYAKGSPLANQLEINIWNRFIHIRVYGN